LTGLLLSFVGFPVGFLVVRVTGVVVGVVVVGVVVVGVVVVGVVVVGVVVVGVVVVGGLVVSCLLRTSSVGLMGFLGLSFPVSGIHILSLNSHKVEGSGFAIVTSGYFVLEVIWESLVELMTKGGIAPVTAGS
jgi:hypothetical protein